MKITLIEPASPGVHVFSKVKAPRLGLPILGTILKNQGHQVTVYVEEIRKVDFSEALASDVVGISTITSTAPRAYRLADRIKRHAPELPVVIGGPHPTFMTREALQHADYCVTGEGEISFPALVEALDEGRTPDHIPGLAYKSGENTVISRRSRTPDLSDLPFADMDLVAGWDSLRLGPFTRRLMPFCTSRGCPHGCRFCSVISMFGRRYRFRPVDDVLEELSRHKDSVIFFYDDNFAADRARTRRLLRGIIDAGLDLQWSAQVRVDIASDPDLLDMMTEAGATMLYIGFESVNQQTLDEYEKGQNLEQMRQAIDTIHDRGLRIHGMFVIGGEGDRADTPRKTVDFALEHGIDTIQLLMLTPVPGTELFDNLRKQERLITDDWEYYDGHHAVFRPANMSPYQMQFEVMKETARFYSLRRCLNLAARLDIANSYFNFYGYKTVKKWIDDVKNNGYLSFLQQNFAT